MSKVIVILVDGMRPDGLLSCGNPYVKTLMKDSAHDMRAQTVFPSVTLPCHMSLFHSVDPDRHGTTTNIYAPQVRPIEGLVERLNRVDKKCAFFINWEELRDLSRPDGLQTCVMINLHKNPEADKKITEAALKYIGENEPDFVFLYLGETDEIGHDKIWMEKEYLAGISGAVDCIRKVRETVSDDYDIILLADHGGHDRAHGTKMPEDMTIPLLCMGKDFTPGELSGLSIKDVAPTVTKLLGATNAREWEGKSII